MLRLMAKGGTVQWRRETPTWKMLAPLWAGVLSTSILFGSWVGAQVLPEEGVSCDPTDLVYTRIHDFPGHAFEDQVPEEADAETADKALDDFLKKEYPKLGKSEFKKTKEEGSEAKFKKEKDGKPVAAVLVEKIGPAWEVTKFTACNSVAKEGSE